MFSQEVGGDFCDAGFDNMMEWFVGTADPYHDAQGAYRWSMAPFLHDDLLKDLHIVVEAVRNTFPVVVVEIRHFLIKFWVWRDEPAPVEAVEAFWVRMGIEADMLDAVVAADPRWVAGVLLISPRIRASDDPIEHVHSIYLYIMRFRTFSDSRWFGEAQSNRVLCASLSVGLDEIVLMARGHALSIYHLHGYERLTLPMRKYAAISTASSFVPEGCYYELLEEERLARSCKTLETRLRSELGFVLATDSLTWQRLVQVIGDGSYDVVSLRSDATHAAHVGFAFLDKRLL